MNLVDFFLTYEFLFKKLKFFNLSTECNLTCSVTKSSFVTSAPSKKKKSNLACSQMSLNDAFLLKLHFIKRTNLEGGKGRNKKRGPKTEKRDSINLAKHFCGSSQLWLNHKID